MQSLPRPGKGSVEQARRINRGRILQLVRKAGRASRPLIARQTDLTEAAVSRITRELINHGLLLEGGASPTAGKPGRPSTDLAINPDGAYVLGFDIGANGQWVTLADACGNAVARRRLAFPTEREPERFLERIAGEAITLVAERANSHGPLTSRLLGCGVAAAGTVASDSRTIMESLNLGWGEVRVSDVLGDALGIPVTVESRPHALAMAEREMGPRPARTDLIVVLVGLGLGSCVMIDGRVLRGHRGRFGQVAHLRSVGNLPCRCGRSGCLDTVASGRAVVRELDGRLPATAEATAAALARHLDAARAGDAIARGIFESAGAALGTGIARLAEVADPMDVLLCGPGAAAEAYVAGVTRALGLPDINIRVSGLDVDAVAAWMALEAFVYSPTLDLQGLQIARAS